MTMPSPGRCTWPGPSPADAARAAAGIGGDTRRGLPPKTGVVLIFVAAVHAASAVPDPDRPVPFTLTPKAHAALEQDATGRCGCGCDGCPACAGDGWACGRCGLGFFGTRPDDGLCRECRGGEAAR